MACTLNLQTNFSWPSLSKWLKEKGIEKTNMKQAQNHQVSYICEVGQYSEYSTYFSLH